MGVKCFEHTIYLMLLLHFEPYTNTIMKWKDYRKVNSKTESKQKKVNLTNDHSVNMYLLLFSFKWIN